MERLGYLYMAGFAFHFFNLYYNLVYVNFPGGNFLTFLGFPGKLKYMTLWNYSLDVFYFALVSIHLASKRRRFKSLVDLLHASLFFPLGLLVCTLYWGLSVFDPDSVSTPEIREIMPVWNDHAMHSLPFVFAVVDAYLIEHDYPSNRKGICVVFGFALTYLSVVLYLGLGPSRVWIYPVLEKLARNAGDLAIFLVFCATAFVVEYFAGKAITMFFWGKKLHGD